MRQRSFALVPGAGGNAGFWQLVEPLLQEAGYQDVASMQGGFGGMRDPFGQIIAPGWASLGFPVSEDNDEGVSYDSLRAKAQGKM